MKIYAITFLAVAGLTFGFATTPLDTLYWLLFTLELPSILFSVAIAFIICAVISIALQFPVIAILVILVIVLIAGNSNQGAGQ